MRLALVALLTGCSFQAKSASSGSPDGSAMHDAPAIDAAIDTPPDAFDARCFGGGAFAVCLSAVPTGAQTLPADVNTSQCTGTGFEIAMMGSTSVCAFAGASVDVADSNLSGSRPLVVVAVGDINETGYVDASSSNARGDGPGANDATCPSTNAGTANANGGGGGAGGSFGTQGAAGGGGGGATGGTAGPVAQAPVTRLRGGCRGGTGGTGNSLSIAAGGSGGGAVMFVARGTINISGTIDASGAGGDGGNNAKGGGGGGGAGGMIVLHGNVAATTSAILFANGGGAGGGAGQGTDGSVGADASSYSTPAAGGANVGGGTIAGGNGATQNAAPTTPGASGNGGGGGGGGVGVIRLLGGASLQNAHYSPAPS